MQKSSINNGQAIIRKATGGFYYVEAADGLVECRARGLFRNQGLKPCVGDRVRISVSQEDGSGTVEEIFPRKNTLVRPPLCNLDYMVMVLSVTDPIPNLQVTDKFLAVLEHKEIEPIIAVTKSDLEDPQFLLEIYEKAGYRVFCVCCDTGEGVEPLTQCLQGKFCAFSGNSGVGKSSLLNAIAPELELQVGDTSKKLGRGRHTTRVVESHRLKNGALVADTPGFTSLDLTVMSEITKEELAGCFREFRDYLGQCKFQDCSHTCEVGCRVLDAAQQGAIAPSRMDSYRSLYNEIKDVKQWERRN